MDPVRTSNSCACVIAIARGAVDCVANPVSVAARTMEATASATMVLRLMVAPIGVRILPT
jgi:hypothetical protein